MSLKKLISLFLLLCGPLFAKATQADGVDLVVFSYDRSLQAHAFFESTFKHLKGLK